jgi:DNA-binding XRE family transcriptional regulator
MTPEQIREARRVLGLSARQLAPLLGYDRLPSVYDIEAGRERPSRAVVLLLRAYLAGYRPPEWPDPPRRPPQAEGKNAANPLNAQGVSAPSS